MKYNSGFTLIEALVVLSLVSILASLTLFFDMSQYARGALHSEERLLMSSLIHARTNAQNNVHGIPHGVALHPNGNPEYVIFEGASFLDSNPDTQRSIPSSFALSTSTPDEIVFEQLSGDANVDAEIVLIDESRNARGSFSVNHEGKIGW